LFADEVPEKEVPEKDSPALFVRALFHVLVVGVVGTVYA